MPGQGSFVFPKYISRSKTESFQKTLANHIKIGAMTLSKINTIYPPPKQTSKSLPQICVKHSPSATIRPVCVKFMNNFFRLYFLFSFLIHFLVWGLDLCSSSSAIRPATTCSVVKSLGKVPTGVQIERGKSTEWDLKSEMFHPVLINSQSLEDP